MSIRWEPIAALRSQAPRRRAGYHDGITSLPPEPDRESETLGGAGSIRESWRTVTVALPAVPGGLAAFELRGETMGEPVSARWDGRSLWLTPLLYRVATVSMAVEGAYAQIGLRTGEPTFADEPMSVAIELLRSLDKVYSTSSTPSPPNADQSDPPSSSPMGGS